MTLRYCKKCGYAFTLDGDMNASQIMDVNEIPETTRCPNCDHEKAVMLDDIFQKASMAITCEDLEALAKYVIEKAKSRGIYRFDKHHP